MADPKGIPQRLPTGKTMRQPTGYGVLFLNKTLQAAPQIPSVGMQTNVHIPERLVTQHGIPGIKAGGQGLSRQIYDRTYYLNILKQKNVELQNEIIKLKDEVETIKKDNQLYVTLERQFDELIKEVRQLEGELADYNLALDKQRSDTKPEDIMAILYHIQAQNERQRRQLDDIFIQRKNKETEIAQIEDQIHGISLAFEERLNELDPDQRGQYERLREENTLLEQEIAKRRTDLDEVSMKLSIAEGRLREDPTKERAQQLHDEKARLQAKKDDLQLQTDEMNLPFPEARERLITKAKEDQAQLKGTEQRIQEIKKLIDAYQKQIKEIETDLETNKAESVDKNKYDILKEKDKEYSDFIDNFEARRGQELEQVAALEKKVQDLLEMMSRNLIKMEKTPTAEETKVAQADINYRAKLVENEANTYEVLKKEVEERANQLKRMENIEENIEKNVKIVKDKMDHMQRELDTKYSHIGELVAKAEADKRRLTALRAYYAAHKDALKEQVTFASMKVDAKKSQLADNDTYRTLVELEKKVAESESSLFSLRQFIDGKKRETNYANSLAECLSLISAINNETIKNVSGTIQQRGNNSYLHSHNIKYTCQ
eukprot:TRINITY_DN377_c0_g1_i2.p1 TRINITY_DN377_c0_g1~~TRINITY_DN377_c0_g1_i2.p1  ORF type:complete len:602 (-),score=123.11 TRINITY_DN377_c0_g1_i2:1138-2943(-)